jgi:transposase-like protein
MDNEITLQDAILYFADFEHCRQFMTELRWPNGVVKCPTCGAEKLTWLAKQRVWKCYAKHPKPTFSLKTGTIFEDSPIPLEKWLPAAWLTISCKNGVSSYEVHRGLGVTQKTAWFMLHRIRLALQGENSGKLRGEVEADETFIGGKARNMHSDVKLRRITGTGDKDKIAVMGIIKRGGKIRTSVVPNRKKNALQAEVRKHVEPGSILYTDSLPSYNDLAEEYQHLVIDHAKCYVEGKVHTNTLENFWSLLKRGISGTYISVEPFHLFRYLDEQAFRYNNRYTTDAERFSIVMKQTVGKRLTYGQLTGKIDTEVAYG